MKCFTNSSSLSEWSNEAKCNLMDFKISEEFDFLKSKSKNVFQNLVKKNARQYELERLQKLQKSKTEKLLYSKLELQEYLELAEMNVRQAKVLFKFRVRMAPFGENFKGGLDTPLCPLCLSHPDTQENSFKCEKIKQLINVKGEYNDIFGVLFSPDLINSLYNIFCFRDEMRKLEEKR